MKKNMNGKGEGKVRLKDHLREDVEVRNDENKKRPRRDN